MHRCMFITALCLLGGCAATQPQTSPPTATAAAENVVTTEKPLQLGNFSVSLTVKDLAASKAFYEKLGFKAIAGRAPRYLIMQNDTATIGLYQGMFDKNILTFNPGWDRNCATLPAFDDVRAIQRTLENKDLTLTTRADETKTGPASVTLIDPDGNAILIDQHVPAATARNKHP